MCKFSEENRIRLGNVAHYIAKFCHRPSKTKMLKLLYLMEEHFALRYQMPFLGIPFEVWQAGPVAKDVFVDLSDGPVLLSDYVAVEQDGMGQFIVPKGGFDEDEFSRNELKVMQDVIARFGGMSASELVQYTHRPGSLWYNEAKEHGLLDAFEKKCCNSSDVIIDFTKAMTPCDADFYAENLEMHRASNHYGTM